MDRHAIRVTLIWMTVCVWSATAAVSISRFHMAARSAVTISLATKPPTVRITIDRDRKLDGGGYIETPTKISLNPGRHEVKIARDGYTAHLVTIDGEAGEPLRMEDVVLVRNPIVGVATVDIQSDLPSAHFEIDDGFTKGETPQTVYDLMTGQQHVLAFYPKWPNREIRLKCKFTPVVTTETYHLRIKTNKAGSGAANGSGNGKYKISGCDPTLPRHH